MQVGEVDGTSSAQESHEPEPETQSPPEPAASSETPESPGSDAPLQDARQYGAFRRAQVERQLDQGETDLNTGSLVGGAVNGRNGSIRQTQNSQEFFGYPPRSQQSDTATLALQRSMNDARVGISSGQTIGALVRADGTVVLGVSGSERSTTNVYDRLQPTVQSRLNEAFRNDPSVRRDPSGNVVFEFGRTQANADGYQSRIRYTDINGQPQEYRGNSSTCVEGKIFQVNGTADAAGMTVKRYQVDGSNRPNDYRSRLQNPNGLNMDPCPSCRVNSNEIVTSSLSPAEARTRALTNAAREYGTSAAIGAGISLVTSTYHALQDGQLTGDELQTIAGQTVLGGGAAVAGNAIERSITSRALVNVNVTSSSLRLAVSQVKGAGVAGAVINTAFAVADQWDNLKNDATRSQAIGTIAGEAVVGAGAGMAGAMAGAAIGSIIPGAGTIVGGVIGFAVGTAAGYLADKGLRGLGVDKAVASAVTGAIDFGGRVASQVGNAISDVGHAIADVVKDPVGSLVSAAGGAVNSLKAAFGW